MTKKILIEDQDNKENNIYLPRRDATKKANHKTLIERWGNNLILHLIEKYMYEACSCLRDIFSIDYHSRDIIVNYHKIMYFAV